MSPAQQGISIIELMVGMAIGLVIVAAGLLSASQYLQEHRTLLLDARLMNDLRAAVDLMARDLRRAAYWHEASTSVWHSESVPMRSNPYSALDLQATDSNEVAFRYSRDTIENHQIDSNEEFGFRLRNAVIEMQLGQGNWQAITDSTALRVTMLHITPHLQQIELSGFCAHECPSDSNTCPPRQQIRSLELQVSARSTAPGSHVRSLQTQVRLRNDTLTGACPT